VPATPLFISDRDTLTRQLRLSGAVQTDTEVAIDDAMRRARMGLLKALGSGRTATIQAITYNENPLTDDEVTRAKANTAEVIWTRLILMRELPVLFMDASAKVQQSWNEEGLTRRAATGSKELEAVISEMSGELDDLLGDLAGDGEVPGINVSTIGPLRRPRPPAASVWRPDLSVAVADDRILATSFPSVNPTQILRRSCD
jgi:hypothetical protein